MARILIIIIAIIALLLFSRWIQAGYHRSGRPFLVKTVLTAVAVVFLLLAATGRVHWVGAMLASAVAALRFVLPMLIKSLPFLHSLHRAKAQQSSGQQQTPAAKQTEMSRVEALDILGLTGNPDEAEIINAHRKLIQKLHPDRGGNDYLAAKINRAKDVLLQTG
jgi:hypothetical protein